MNLFDECEQTASQLNDINELSEKFGINNPDESVLSALSKMAELQYQNIKLEKKADRLFKQMIELKNSYRGIVPKTEHTGYCLQRVEDANRSVFVCSYRPTEQSKMCNEVIKANFQKLTIELPFLATDPFNETKTDSLLGLREIVYPKLFSEGFLDLSDIPWGDTINNGSAIISEANSAVAKGIPVIVHIGYTCDFMTGFWRAIIYTTQYPQATPWEVCQPCREQVQHALKNRKKAQKRQPRPRPKEIA